MAKVTLKEDLRLSAFPEEVGDDGLKIYGEISYLEEKLTTSGEKVYKDIRVKKDFFHYPCFFNR